MSIQDKNYLANLKKDVDSAQETLDLIRLRHQASQQHELSVLEKKLSDLLQAQHAVEINLHEILEKEAIIVTALNALSPSSREYKEKYQRRTEINEICSKYESDMKQKQAEITKTKTHIDQLKAPTSPKEQEAIVALNRAQTALQAAQSSRKKFTRQLQTKTVPSRFDRTADAITAKLAQTKDEMDNLETSINQAWDQAKAVLAQDSSPKKEPAPSYAKQDIEALEKKFEDLNIRIERKQNKTGCFRAWKPIYNLFRQFFGIERKLTKLTSQQAEAIPIFDTITALLVKSLELEEQTTQLHGALQQALDDRSHLKELALVIQKKLEPYCTTHITTFFSKAPRLEKDIAPIAKALTTFLGEPTEANLEPLSATMSRAHPRYLENKDFQTLIVEASGLYEVIDKLYHDHLELKQLQEDLHPTDTEQKRNQPE
jgi:hypothetical protein